MRSWFVPGGAKKRSRVWSPVIWLTFFPVTFPSCVPGNRDRLPLHASVNARIWAAKKFGMKFKPVSEEKPTLFEKAIAWVILVNFSHLTQQKMAGYHLPVYRNSFIKLYLYAFKGLQIFQNPKRVTHSIGIIGGSIWGNRGAEAMLVTTIGKLKEEISGCRIQSLFDLSRERPTLIIHDPKIQLLSSKPFIIVIDFSSIFHDPLVFSRKWGSSFGCRHP